MPMLRPKHQGILYPFDSNFSASQVTEMDGKCASHGFLSVEASRAQGIELPCRIGSSGCSRSSAAENWELRWSGKIMTSHRK